MIPNSLPTLSAGPHEPGSGKACVMEYVSLLAGESWSDTPQCTYHPLARAAQIVNDYLDDSHRNLLVPLIGRLFGTTLQIDDRRFALQVARTVEHLHPAARACNDVTEAFLDGNASVNDLRVARAAAADAYTHDAATAAAAAARAASTMTTTYAVISAAHAVSGNDASDEVVVSWLNKVIDIYDKLSGRINYTTLTNTELSLLATKVN